MTDLEDDKTLKNKEFFNLNYSSKKLTCSSNQKHFDSLAYRAETICTFKRYGRTKYMHESCIKNQWYEINRKIRVSSKNVT